MINRFYVIVLVSLTTSLVSAQEPLQLLGSACTPTMDQPAIEPGPETVAIHST